MLTTVIIVVIVAAVAFFGGTKYQQTQAVGNGGQFAHGDGGPGQQARSGGRGRFGGATIGEIITTDANSITVKLQDGSSKIVNISGSTTFSKTDTASKSDLKTGERIAAFGAANSDGSITAQNVQLNPMFRDGQGGNH